MTAIYGASGYATTDDTPRPPVRILRPSSTRFSRDAVGRVLSYGSFLAGALVAGFRVGRPDTVVTLTTPPLTSVFGRMLKLSRGCRHFIWEMDVYPDIAVDLGALKPRSLLTCLIGALADWSRRNADGIIVLGEEMKARLIARDIPAHKIHVAENWADGAEITPLPFPKGRWWCTIQVTSASPTISILFRQSIRRYANDPRFSLYLPVAASAASNWRICAASMASPTRRSARIALAPKLGRELGGRTSGVGDPVAADLWLHRPEQDLWHYGSGPSSSFTSGRAKRRPPE